MGIEAAKKVRTLIFVVITIVIALITAITAIVPNPENSSFLVYIAIGMPMAIILNLVIALYWACRLRIWFVIPIIAILVNWNYLSAVIQFKSSDKTDHNLKVATYNVGSFNQEITGYTAKEISKFMDAQEGVDILCMQEYTGNSEFNLDSLSNTFGKYPHQFVPTDKKGKTRVVIFSKYPILDSKRIAFKNTDNCSAYADISVKGKIVRVFCVHLQTTSLQRDLSRNTKYDLDAETSISNIEKSLLENAQIRTKQAQFISAMVKKSPHPVILCGDCNSIPSTYEYEVLSSVLKDGFKECGSGYAYSFNRFLKTLRIDYIFISDSIEGIRYYSVPQKWSDHNPVMMELNLGTNALK